MITLDRKLPMQTLAALTQELISVTSGAVMGVSSGPNGTVVHVDANATPEIENTIIQTVLTWDATKRTQEETQLENLLSKVKTLQQDVKTTETAIAAAADLAALKTQLVTLADQVQTLTRYVKRLGGL